MGKQSLSLSIILAKITSWSFAKVAIILNIILNVSIILSNALPLKDLIFDGKGVTDLGSTSPPTPDQIRKVVFDRFPNMFPGQP